MGKFLIVRAWVQDGWHTMPCPLNAINPLLQSLWVPSTPPPTVPECPLKRWPFPHWQLSSHSAFFSVAIIITVMAEKSRPPRGGTYRDCLSEGFGKMRCWEWSKMHVAAEGRGGSGHMWYRGQDRHCFWAASWYTLPLLFLPVQENTLPSLLGCFE